MQPRFKVGQLVAMMKSRHTSVVAGDYRIISHVPDEGREPSYRIRSLDEKHERVARESEFTLSSTQDPPEVAVKSIAISDQKGARRRLKPTAR